MSLPPFLPLLSLFLHLLFLPLFFQLVLGMAPAKAGLMMAPMTGGMILTSFLGGRQVSRTGKYKIYPVAGLAAAALSFLALMVLALRGGGIVLVEATLIVLGCGFGLAMPNLVVALQNAVSSREQGAATATGAFFRSLGGTFGAALAGAIMTWQLSAHAGKWSGSAMQSLAGQGLQQIARLPPEQHEAVIAAYRHAISMTFLTGALITLAAFALVLFLPEHPLKTSHTERASR